ncbi:MAG: hypothetical protein JJU31_14205 [Wenzhouxiangella sp.]|nr:hypothetical protein [Wenzhouxiangella sp.]MCH8478740.1 hypothetical protein [Wenzhouxiangella sp.]
MNDPSHDLAYIRNIVEQSRRAARVDALPLAIWGALTAAGVLVTLLVPALDSVWLWVFLIGLAWAYSAARTLKRRGRRGSILFAQRILTTLWLSTLAAMTVVGFAGVFSQVLPPQAIPPVFAGMFGVGLLTSAVLMDKRWIAACGMGWWLGAVVLFLIAAEWRLGVYGVLIVALLIAPSLVIHRETSDK